MQTWKIGVLRYTVLFWWCAGILTGCSGSKNLMEGQTDTALFDQGKLYYDQKDYEKALPYFLYVKEHFIRSPHAGLTRFYAGECYFAEEKYEEAAGEYQSFLAFFPNDANASAAQYKLGVSYLKQSRGSDRDQTMLQKAWTELEKVGQKYPDQEDYVKQAEEQLRETKRELALHEFQIATFYRKGKHYTASNRRFDYLMREYPESPLIGDALFYQGLNYLDLKQPENAKTAFLHLIQTYPENRYVSDAQKHLTKLGVTDIVQPIRPRSSATDASKVLSQPKSSEPTNPQPSPVAGYVVTIRDNTIFTNLVREDGIQEGMVLEIQRDNKLIGTIRITEVHDGFSAAKIESTMAGMTIQEEDQVCCPKTKE